MCMWWRWILLSQSDTVVWYHPLKMYSVKMCAAWEDVVYENKSRPCTEPWVKWKTCMRGCRWGEVFFTFTFLWERSVKWKTLFCLLKSPKSVKCLWAELMQRISSRGGLYYLVKLSCQIFNISKIFTTTFTLVLCWLLDCNSHFSQTEIPVDVSIQFSKHAYLKYAIKLVAHTHIPHMIW